MFHAINLKQNGMKQVRLNFAYTRVRERTSTGGGTQHAYAIPHSTYTANAPRVVKLLSYS